MKEVSFVLTEKELKIIEEVKGENTWRNFVFSHQSVQDYLIAINQLKQMRESRKKYLKQTKAPRRKK